MTKWMLAAGAAALAIVTPALAQKGHGGDKGQGQGQSAKPDRGGGGNGAKKADRGNGGGQMRAERKTEQRFVQRDVRGNKGQKQARIDRGRKRSPPPLFAMRTSRTRSTLRSDRTLSFFEPRSIRACFWPLLPRWSRWTKRCSALRSARI